MTEGVIATVGLGDVLTLSDYLAQPVNVIGKQQTTDGPLVIVRSTGGNRYRLRAVDDDDARLLMEKPADDGWTAHCRVEADQLTINPDP